MRWLTFSLQTSIGFTLGTWTSVLFATPLNQTQVCLANFCSHQMNLILLDQLPSVLILICSYICVFRSTRRLPIHTIDIYRFLVFFIDLNAALVYWYLRVCKSFLYSTQNSVYKNISAPVYFLFTSDIIQAQTKL